MGRRIERITPLPVAVAVSVRPLTFSVIVVGKMQGLFPIALDRRVAFVVEGVLKTHPNRFRRRGGRL